MIPLKDAAWNCFSLCSQAAEDIGLCLYLPSTRPLEKTFNTIMLTTGSLAGVEACLTGGPVMAGLAATTVLLPLARFRQEGADLRHLPPPRGFRVLTF